MFLKAFVDIVDVHKNTFSWVIYLHSQSQAHVYLMHATYYGYYIAKQKY